MKGRLVGILVCVEEPVFMDPDHFEHADFIRIPGFCEDARFYKMFNRKIKATK